MSAHDLSTVGIGYTLATGRLFCDFPEFQKYAEHLLDRPILTHEFGEKHLWDELRAAFEWMVTDVSAVIEGRA